MTRPWLLTEAAPPGESAGKPWSLGHRQRNKWLGLDAGPGRGVLRSAKTSLGAHRRKEILTCVPTFEVGEPEYMVGNFRAERLWSQLHA